MEIKELKNPYGAYRIKYNDSVAYQCGALENEDQLNEIHQQIGELIHTGVEVELFSINRFVDGEIVTIDIIDNGPKIDGAGFSEEDRVAE